MDEFDRFRHELAAMLLAAADRRQQSFAGRRPSGEDLKVIALFERLAADAARLDPSAYRHFGWPLAHEPLARHFSRRRDALLAELGITGCPRSATELVTWLHGQVVDPDMPAAQISISVPISTTCAGGTSK